MIARLRVGQRLNAFDALQPLYQRITKLHELMEDTLVLLGNDLYLASLDHYAYAKRAGAADGLDELKSMLSKRFDHSGAAKTATPPAN